MSSEIHSSPQSLGLSDFLPTSTVSKKTIAGTYIFPLVVFSTFFCCGAAGWTHRYFERYIFIIWIFCWCIFGIVLFYQFFWIYMGYRKYLKWRIIYISLTFLALIWAHIQSDAAYYGWSLPVFALKDLATYVSIDPATEKGQSYMDSGKVYFKDGARIAIENARAYKDKHLFCIAPIVGRPLSGGSPDSSSAVSSNSNGDKKTFILPPSGTVDFWAVGVDCCDSNGKNFQCGQVGDAKAHAGLRLIRDDQRVFYRLAVQQWSTEFNLPSHHPLFYHWVRDPIAELHRFENNIYWSIWMNILTFTLTNALLSFVLYLLIPEWTVSFKGETAPLLQKGSKERFMRQLAMQNQQKLFGVDDARQANCLENKLLTWNEQELSDREINYFGDSGMGEGGGGTSGAQI